LQCVKVGIYILFIINEGYRILMKQMLLCRFRSGEIIFCIFWLLGSRATGVSSPSFKPGVRAAFGFAFSAVEERVSRAAVDGS